MVAAREAADPQIRQYGAAGGSDPQRFVVYASDQAHSSIEKAAIVLGVGQEGFRKIPVESEDLGQIIREVDRRGFSVEDAADQRGKAL